MHHGKASKYTLAVEALTAGEALDVVDALIVLEMIACEWHGEATDFDRPGPTRLQVMSGKLKQQFYTSTPLAA